MTEADYPLTDLGNARRLVDLYGDRLRYVAPLGGWLAHDGRRWRRDDTEQVMRYAKDTARHLLDRAADEVDTKRRELLAKHALEMMRVQRLDAMIRLARSEPEIVARLDQFDADPWAFNVANGTLDLRTGTLRPHDPEDYITKLAPVAFIPKAAAPTFLQFIRDVFSENPALIAYIQRALGYAMTGTTGEQVFLLWIGTGANGKGALTRIAEACFGDYFKKADFSTFTASRSEKVREDIADLVSVRLLSAEEGREGARLDESLLKGLTGQDTISARHLYSPRFSFRPECKLILATNHRPHVSGGDKAIWRRLHLVPFERTFVPDLTLEPRMHDELPGVLAWMVEGCLAWQREGLNPPAKVRAASEDYREDEDVFGAFLLECVQDDADAETLTDHLYQEFSAWAKERGVRKPLSIQAFGNELTGRGFGKHRDSTTGKVVRTGLRLRPDATRRLHTPNTEGLFGQVPHEGLTKGDFPKPLFSVRGVQETDRGAA